MAGSKTVKTGRTPSYPTLNNRGESSNARARVRIRTTRQNKSFAAYGSLPGKESEDGPLGALPIRPLGLRGQQATSAAGYPHAHTLKEMAVNYSNTFGHPLLRLQHSRGNRHVQRVVRLAKQAYGDAQITPDVEQAIQSARGGGQPLDSNVRAQMEPAFGVDFSSVRVHTDSRADSLNQSMNARAFTTGHDIFFSRQEYIS